MARENFAAVMVEIHKFEGGFTKDSRDPGNWTGGKVGSGKLLGTNMGIAANTYPKEDIPNLTKERAGELYRRDFWNPIRGDDLPAGVDYATMDGSVNSGKKRGVQWLQRAVGLTGTAADGSVGPKTLDAVATRHRASGSVKVVKDMCAIRMGFLRGLKTFTTFGKGWSRRVANVEAVGVKMAMLTSASPGTVREVLIGESEKAKITASKETQKGGTTAVAGGGAVGSEASGVTDLTGLPEWAWIVVGVIVVIIAIRFIGNAKHDKDRAEAYEAAAVTTKP